MGGGWSDPAEAMTESVSLIDVTKLYRLSLLRRKIGVEGLSLSAESGQILGVLGPNGSGKSTTFKLLLGFLRPTSGNILVRGEPLSTATRRHIGYLPENPRFPGFIFADQALKYYGHLHGLSGAVLDKKCAELLELVGLKHAAHERVRGFSKGMGQRLAIAQSLLNDPSLLIFDEPMSGLDPVGRIEVRDLIRKVHERFPQATILLSTHILSDAENLCSHIALLRKGKLVRHGAMTEVLKSPAQNFQVVIRGVSAEARPKWEKEWGAIDGPMGLQLRVHGVKDLERCLHLAQDEGDEVVDVSSEKVSLERALFQETAEVTP